MPGVTSSVQARSDGGGAARDTETREIWARGVVQGVGFRPFVYTLARDVGVLGWVRNTSAGVQIRAQGTPAQLDSFIARLTAEAPPRSFIAAIEQTQVDSEGYESFVILESAADPDAYQLVSPDIALCDDCRRELLNPADRRHGYPFINCTNCGPRFTIIESLPYDRARTTMRHFPLCPACRLEYEDPGDRRFHAEPNACPVCGPRTVLVARRDLADSLHMGRPDHADGDLANLLRAAGSAELLARGEEAPLGGGDGTGDSAEGGAAVAAEVADGLDLAVLAVSDASSPARAVERAAELLAAGHIVAVKGLGGFHLACDAGNEAAVLELKQRKGRPHKPLAVMFADLEQLRCHCRVGDDEAALLQSPEQPIVLLEWRELGPSGEPRDEVGGRSEQEIANSASRSLERETHEEPREPGPASAAPVSSAPVSAAVSATPVSAAPASLAHASAAPVSPAPVSATPASATPASAAPASATPASTAPASAAPVSSAPVSAAPASAVPISAEVAVRQRYLGAMLPYTPLHLLLLKAAGRPLVMTSGNRAEEPIVTGMTEVEAVAGIPDAWLLHDRAIRARYDDSVALVRGGRPRLVRRSRGYAPFPVALPRELPQVLACGAELKNTFCMTRDRNAFISPHIGDLENLETLEHYERSVELYKRLFRLEPVIVAYDLHPEYLATKYALALGDKWNQIGVQHHHAHVASCMAENGREEPVIGVSLDGLGFGADGTLWGGEFLVADYTGFVRAAHLEALPLPGGEAAIRRPCRTAAAWVWSLLGPAALDQARRLGLAIDDAEAAAVVEQARSGVNSPLTSSCGRLFDAVAALAGLRSEITYEGQAAIELEMLSSPGAVPYPVMFDGDVCSGLARDPAAADGLSGPQLLPAGPQPPADQHPQSPAVLRLAPILDGVIEDRRHGATPADVGSRLHATVAAAVVEMCGRLRDAGAPDVVALSGGVFQNRLLTELTETALAGRGFTVLTHSLVPANDGGLSLGQAVIAGYTAVARS